jgi:hypothetical protein
MPSWVWRPFRSKPEPVSEEPAALEPPVVDEVSRSVRDAANVLAQRIWSTGAQPRSHLLRGINPPDAERYLSHAVAQDWVVVDGDLVIRGAVNPVPLPEPVSALEQRLRWGPGWD